MIGKFLKHRREAKGLTQDYIANSLNVSRQAVSNWENEVREINIRDLIAYSKLLEISFEDLEVHINHSVRIDEVINMKSDVRTLPEHFDYKLRKTVKNSKRKKRIKIEGDKVIGVHLLLTSLFFENQELVIKNCPTALDFLNILYEFGNNGWVDT
ncbi:helix-turn-helix domain-containing protein [Streptococcus pluranimalium]|uniref:helix-turn-helix domain-containing protein n=1 Tax=Streptococcus pluranimalium TaxID=82348 RepID=UPI003BF8DAF8